MDEKTKELVNEAIKKNKNMFAIATLTGIVMGLIPCIIYSIACIIFSFHWLHVVMLGLCVASLAYLKRQAKHISKKIFKVEVSFDDSSNLQKAE